MQILQKVKDNTQKVKDNTHWTWKIPAETFDKLFFNEAMEEKIRLRNLQDKWLEKTVKKWPTLSKMWCKKRWVKTTALRIMESFIQCMHLSVTTMLQTSCKEDYIRSKIDIRRIKRKKNSRQFSDFCVLIIVFETFMHLNELRIYYLEDSSDQYIFNSHKL